MNRLLIIAVLTAFSLNSYSQDLIVTAENDSLNCKITKIKEETIYFTFSHKGEIRNTLLPLSQVKYHQQNFFEKTEVPADKVIFPGRKHSKFRIAVNSGYSRLLAKTAEDVPADFKPYINELKSGYHFSADGTYFLSDSWGLGAKYSLFRTSNQTDIYTKDNSGTGIMRDDITVNFIGPNFSMRHISKDEKHTFLMGYALGYLHYNNNAVVMQKVRITGEALGINVDFAYDIRLSKNLSLGAQISLLGGTLTSVTKDNGTVSEKHQLEKGEYESLSRLDLSLGLRLNF